MTLHSIPSHLREHWPRWLLAAAVAVHLAMMGSLFWGYLNPFFASSDLNPQGIDFFSIYEAGHRALENHSLYVDDPTSSRVTPYYVFFRYVPVFAYGFAIPANAIPPWPAYWGWVALNQLFLVVNAYVTWRIAGRGRWGLLAAAMWFVFTPFYLEQNMGQFSFVMATAVLWVGVGIVRRREIVAGPPWVVSLVIKSNSALLGPVFLHLGWWRSVAAGAALAALNIPYFIFRHDDIEFFYKANVESLFESGGRYFAYNPDIQGILALIRNSVLAFDSTAEDLPFVVPLVVILAVVALALAATFLPRTSDPLALLAIWVCAYFLVYEPWEHHYVMMLPVLVLLTALRPAARPWALAVFVLLALPTPYWLLDHVWNRGPVPPSDAFVSHQEAWPAWGVILDHASKPVPVLALWAYLVVSQLRQGFDVTWVQDLLEPLRRRAALPASK